MRAHTAALVLVALACRAHDSSQPQRLPTVDSSSPQVSPAPDSTPARSSQPTEPLGTLYGRLTAIGKDRATVRSALGEPRLTTTAPKSNAYDSTAVDTIVKWTFDHVHFTFLVAGGSDFLVETRADPDYPAVAPLIGQFRTLEAADATLGPPSWTSLLADTTVWGYNIPEPDIGVSHNAVNLYFKSGQLRFVAAVPYLDYE